MSPESLINVDIPYELTIVVDSAKDSMWRSLRSRREVLFQSPQFVCAEFSEYFVRMGTPFTVFSCDNGRNLKLFSSHQIRSIGQIFEIRRVNRKLVLIAVSFVNVDQTEVEDQID